MWQKVYYSWVVGKLQERINMSRQNIKSVNNTGVDLRPLASMFDEAYKTGAVPTEYADVFVIEILKGYNPDGSDRMIINFA